MFHAQFKGRSGAALLVCLAASAFAFIGQANAQFGDVVPPPEALKTGFDSITAEQSKEFLSVLAGPGFEGRGTGQEGYTKAAHWIAGKLAEYGLKPVGNNGTYFQMLPMKRRVLDIEDCSIKGPNGLVIKAEGNFGLERFTDQQSASGEVVFVNFSDPKATLSDDVILRDKLVIYYAAPEARNITLQIARKRPLASIRVIEGVPQSRSQLVSSGRASRNTSVSGTITKEAATQLAEALGGKAAWVEASDMPGLQVNETGKSIDLEMRFHPEDAAVPNVVALLEGSDPKLASEYIVVGSHLDHLGISNGQVFPGADDNGSGSTANLEIARAMALNPIRPKRSVLFIWFAAEEIGLVGSKYYTDNPTLPLDKMTCMFNIDMVGRNEETPNETAEENEGSIHLVGSKKGNSGIHELVEKANQHVGFRFELDQEDVFGRSDQINFYRKGVPVAFIFGGFHPDYHQPGDLPSKINYKKIASAAKLYYMAINYASEHGRFTISEDK